MKAIHFLHLLVAVGLCGAGWISVYLTELDKMRVTGSDIGPVRAAIGGMILMFGAQITGASVLGHLFTGFGHLSLNSFLCILFTWTTAFGVVTLF